VLTHDPKVIQGEIAKCKKILNTIEGIPKVCFFIF
jgi:hypothetical protein